jgi:hypothetical protein
MLGILGRRDQPCLLLPANWTPCVTRRLGEPQLPLHELTNDIALIDTSSACSLTRTPCKVSSTPSHMVERLLNPEELACQRWPR